MPIPETPEDLTAEWLSTVLGATVAAVDVDAIQSGDGFFGQVLRLWLAYAEGQSAGPATLIAKLSSTDPRLRTRLADSYRREVRFYQDLASQVPVPVPGCHYADVDPEMGTHVLLLEDLGAGSPDSPLTMAEAKEAIADVAELHSQWWEHPDLSSLAWLSVPEYDGGTLQQFHDEWWPPFFERAGHILSPEAKAVGERLGGFRAGLMTELFGRAPATLIHRDYKPANMIPTDPNHRSAVIDWQSISVGRGTWDVAYLISQYLGVEDRRQTEESLLRDYHHALVGGGVAGYSLDDCLRDYRLALLQRFGSLISTIASIPFTPEQQQRHIDVLLPRVVAAVMDHGGMALFDTVSPV